MIIRPRDDPYGIQISKNPEDSAIRAGSELGLLGSGQGAILVGQDRQLSQIAETQEFSGYMVVRETVRKMPARALSALALMTLSGCSPDSTVALYAHNYKGALIEVCERNGACTADVEKFFDQCLDRNEVERMLLTFDPERSRNLNSALQRKTVQCINAASGVNYFYHQATEDKKT